MDTSSIFGPSPIPAAAKPTNVCAVGKLVTGVPAVTLAAGTVMIYAVGSAFGLLLNGSRLTNVKTKLLPLFTTWKFWKIEPAGIAALMTRTGALAVPFGQAHTSILPAAQGLLQEKRMPSAV